MSEAPANVLESLRASLKQRFPARAAEIEALAPDASLFKAGFVDSLSFLELVNAIEDVFGIAIPPQDFLPTKFATLEMIAGYVRDRVAAGAPT